MERGWRRGPVQADQRRGGGFDGRSDSALGETQSVVQPLRVFRRSATPSAARRRRASPFSPRSASIAMRRLRRLG